MLRIFSKFQDYYDCTIGSFAESDIVIHRDTKTYHVLEKELEPLGDFDGKWDYIENGSRGKIFCYHYIGMVGFCGKWYFFTYEHAAPTYTEIRPETIEYKTMDEIKKNNGDKSLFGWKKSANYKDPNKEKFWNFDIFEKYGPVLFIENYRKTPKYQYYPEHKQSQIRIVSWPNLKNLDMQTVLDPYTALWELEHWFDSHARPDDAVVPVGDDITRLQAYGFDKKTSFRKPKEKDR